MHKKQIGAQKATDVAELELGDFQRFMNINNTGMFLVTKHATITMRAQEALPVSASNAMRGATRGSIVNVASGNSLVAVAGLMPYTTSKHAVLGMTKTAGKSLFSRKCQNGTGGRVAWDLQAGMVWLTW